ncbi:MAG: alpha/beta hydrolase, partial [Anaerolineales bacterium]
GLVLWASYPADDSLRKSNLKVISIYGSKDRAGMAPFEKSHTLLPANTQYVIIPGGNHSQFGDYGLQPGDNPAAISSSDQQEQVVQATVQFLQNLSR